MIRLHAPTFRVDQLMRWQQKGLIRPIMRGWYLFQEEPLTEALLMLIANKLITPSYISLEFAFSLYNLIPEGVFQITSITSKKTQCHETPFATFNYRHLKASLLFGYHLRETPYGNLCIADAEKAILDFLYLTSAANHQNFFDEMRLNQVVLKTFDFYKFKNYLAAFKNNALEKRFKRLLDYVTH